MPRYKRQFLCLIPVSLFFDKDVQLISGSPLAGTEQLLQVKQLLLVFTSPRVLAGRRSELPSCSNRMRFAVWLTVYRLSYDLSVGTQVFPAPACVVVATA